jgi:hypothetical protein
MSHESSHYPPVSTLKRSFHLGGTTLDVGLPWAKTPVNIELVTMASLKYNKDEETSRFEGSNPTAAALESVSAMTTKTWSVLTALDGAGAAQKGQVSDAEILHPYQTMNIN